MVEKLPHDVIYNRHIGTEAQFQIQYFDYYKALFPKSLKFWTKLPNVNMQNVGLGNH
jgi:hypothetical protein